MIKIKLFVALCVAIGATVAAAKPIVNITPDTKGGISKTITESWQLSEMEKKNYVYPSYQEVMTMSSISATAIAPTLKIKKGNWTALTSQHRACFYNTFNTTMDGKYLIKFNVAGKEVNAFDVVPVGASQGFCITRYLEVWVKGQRPGDSQSIATTHVEMDGNATDNEGRGIITVR